MFSTLQVLAVGFLTALSYYVLSAIHLCLWGPLSRLPGPFLTKFTALPDFYHAFAEDRTFWVHSLHQTYGPAVRTGPNSVSVTGVDAIKKIHGIGSKPYNKWPGYTKFIQVLGPGVEAVATLCDSTDNARRRKIYAPHFTRQSLLTLSDRIEGCISRFGLNIERLRTQSSQGVVEILRPMRSAALDVITDIAYGGSWKGKEADGLDFTKVLDTVFYCQTLRAVAEPLYKILLHVPLKSLDWVHASNISIQLSHDSIESYAQAYEASTEKPKEPLADILFTPVPETGVPLPRREQELETLVMLIAGTDTSSASGTLTTWEIAKHPCIMARLQKELDDVFPDVSVESVLSIRDAEKATWLTACIKEGLRLYPGVPGPMPRVVPAGGAQLAGVVVPEETVVFVQPYTAHRNPAIFPEPEVFKPERWLEETQDMRISLVAFSQGPRLCLGYNLAWMELRLMLAFLFRNYKVSPAPGVELELKDGFTLHPKGGDCPILLERRERL